MNKLGSNVPVLFLVFNRPQLALRVFAAIRQARPAQLFIAADGPREGQSREEELCQAARAVVQRVDWPCKVNTRFQDENLGCKTAVSSAIDWFFQHVEAGIILEEDCLPSVSFFKFCAELLDHWHDDERVMQISGSNFLLGYRTAGSEGSYYFSRLNDVWGWATWRRAWRHFDLTMSHYPLWRESDRLKDYLPDASMRDWLMRYFEQAYGRVGQRSGDWSSLWQFAIASQNGLTAVPRVNLVANIGIGESATNTRGEEWAVYGSVGVHEISEIRHPAIVLPDSAADERRFELIARTDPRAKAAAHAARTV